MRIIQSRDVIETPGGPVPLGRRARVVLAHGDRSGAEGATWTRRELPDATLVRFEQDGDVLYRAEVPDGRHVGFRPEDVIEVDVL